MIIKINRGDIMIQLNKDLRNWIKYSLKAANKSRQEIAKEIGISFSYLAMMTKKNKTVSVHAAMRVLKYLNYPNLDGLKLDILQLEEKIHKKKPVYNRQLAEFINKYNLSISEAAKICGVSRQRISSILKEKSNLKKNTYMEIINKIITAMETRNDE